MLLYLPGCDVRKNHPETITRLEKYMTQRGADLLNCCKNNGTIADKNDTIIYNCTQCEIILQERCPNTTQKSLYEYVLNDPKFPWKDYRNEPITVQDCWRTRNDRNLQIAAREVLKRMNFDIVETEDNFEKTKFCGVWLYNEPQKESVAVAPIAFRNIMKNYMRLLPQEEQIRRMQERVKLYETDKVLVYCNGCERGIRLGGGNPVYIVELISACLL